MKPAFDMRPRFGHNHCIGASIHAWTKVTYMAHAKGYVMARRPQCTPFVLTEKQWLAFPIYAEEMERRAASTRSGSEGEQ